MDVHAASWVEIVRARCAPPARQWWDSALAALRTPSAKSDLAKAYTKAVRLLGSAPVEFTQDEEEALSSAEVPQKRGCPLHELGRTALLLCATKHLPSAEHAELIDELFVRGDNAERETLLRTLPLLPEPSRFLSTAIEACRTNVQTVFEAIACENPYPVRFFPELHFNQMVMKAMFVGVALRRIVGLSTRVTPMLMNMAEDYKQERAAAGRSVPEDIGLVVGAG